MENNLKKKLIAGYIMAFSGFFLILFSLGNYFLGWKTGLPPAAIGIVFLAVGMGWVRKVRMG
jgi:hypothetical protein